MKFRVILGREKRGSEIGWSSMKIDGAPAGIHDAIEAMRLGYGSWHECVFDVKPGTHIQWVAGSDIGGKSGDRLKYELVADDKAPYFEMKGALQISCGYIQGNFRIEGEA